LSPAERLAFVLHDVFDLPFEEIAGLVGRSPVAARQLASRARRRVRGAEVKAPGTDPRRQREVVDAFFAAARAGDFAALAKLLDPDVVLRADFGTGRPPAVVRGASAVAKLAREPRGARAHPVLVNGKVGMVITVDGRPHSVLAFTVVNGAIARIDSIGDRERVSRIAAAARVTLSGSQGSSR
jgi:RNA polymerase sigma-70 factor (ECF subfamily)